MKQRVVPRVHGLSAFAAPQILRGVEPIIKGSDNGFLEPVDLNLGFGFRFCLNRTVLGTRHVAPE